MHYRDLKRSIKFDDEAMSLAMDVRLSSPGEEEWEPRAMQRTPKRKERMLLEEAICLSVQIPVVEQVGRHLCCPVRVSL